jgi:propionate CoA-transferase
MAGYVTGYSAVPFIVNREAKKTTRGKPTAMKAITAREAAQLVKSGGSVMISGSGGGHCIPESILVEIEQRYLAEALPRDLCLIHVVGLGDRATKGVARFCHDGMIRRSITSALIDSPAMIPMVLQDKIESYTLPQGVLSQITRDIAGGRPGLITKVGLHTFIDPRQLGGRQSPSAKEDLVELMTIDGEESAGGWAAPSSSRSSGWRSATRCRQRA